MKMTNILAWLFMLSLSVAVLSCKAGKKPGEEGTVVNKPLVSHIYTADPSAHVFEGKLYIYPSHDLENNIPDDEWGSQFDMKDYHVFSITSFDKPVVDHGEVLHVKDVPWAQKQMWAPDAAYKNGTFYLYFPAKDAKGIFHIGVATSKKPYGPFKVRPKPIPGSYSMDPAVFVDDDGKAYMYFGGLRGGQLEHWPNNNYSQEPKVPGPDEPGLNPRVVRMSKDMVTFAEPVKELKLLDENKKPVLEKDMVRKFFEAAWMHKYKGTYYFSYSTGYNRTIVYATSKSPYGPFVYKGVILNPVSGWTNHHSVVKYKGKWYLFYHDCTLSNGKMNLRNIKYTKLFHNDDGTIDPVKQ